MTVVAQNLAGTIAIVLKAVCSIAPGQPPQGIIALEPVTKVEFFRAFFLE
jgi:hypothetical protein